MFDSGDIGSGTGRLVTKMTINGDNMNVNRKVTIHFARENRAMVQKNDLTHGLSILAPKIDA